MSDTPKIGDEYNSDSFLEDKQRYVMPLADLYITKDLDPIITVLQKKKKSSPSGNGE